MKNSIQIYNKKRDFKKTNETVGKKQKSFKKLRYVIQYHEARKNHFDFRLEYNGVLLSWAVPKGQYGAGTVLIYDEGTWEACDNFSKSFKKGKMKFKLNGKRFKGIWNLIRFKNDNKKWLLIKEKELKNENYLLSGDITSIKSGKTTTQIKKENRI